MTMYDDLTKIKNIIQQRKPNFKPKAGIILGSGLGPLAEKIESRVDIPYKDLPNFPVSHVAGHEGTLVLGDLCGVPVACLKGRVHLYEGLPNDKIRILIRLIKFLGCEFIITTNAVGSLRKEIVAGDISLITDHINFVQHSPLFGPNDDEFGPRFFAMTNAYDPELREKMKKAAKENNISLHEGVYAMTCGPSFETIAECKALRILGADTVGMSTVSDVLVARHCGLKVLGISAVTNLSADLNTEVLSHEQTLRGAELAGEKLVALVHAFFCKYRDEFNR